jgi:hypothetical protein
MECSVVERSLKRWIFVYMVLAAIGICLFMLGCGSESVADESEASLSAEEAKKELQKLPYRYEFIEVTLPDRASAAVAGRAYGRHRTSLTFGVSFGDRPMPVSVPGKQFGDISGTPYFTYASNLQEPGKKKRWEHGKQLHTKAQWNEAIDMTFEMEQRLCKAITHKPCPI